MKRHETIAKVDTHIFRNTAARTKKVNVQPVDMRGGFRM